MKNGGEGRGCPAIVKIKLNALTILLPFSIWTHSLSPWFLVPSPLWSKKIHPLSWISLFLLCNFLLYFFHFSLHLPISRCGIRLRADVASCSFLVQPSWPWPASYHPYLSESLDLMLTSSSIFFHFFHFSFFIYIFFWKKEWNKIK